MSDRDPRFEPMNILLSASESDADTEEQRIAIKSFHSYTSGITENKTSIMFFSSVLETMEGSSLDDPVVQHAKSQIDLCEKNIGRLNEKIFSLLGSGVLDPVIHKLIDKMMEEDIARLIHKKNAKKDSCQKKPESIRMSNCEERKSWHQGLEETTSAAKIKHNAESAHADQKITEEKEIVSENITKKNKQKDKFQVIFWIILLAVPPVLGICFQLHLESAGIERIGNGSFLWGLIVSAGAIWGAIRVARGIFALIEQEEKEGKTSYIRLFLHIFTYICLFLVLHRI